MTSDNIELSRRKLLAGVGTAGVAAAGAGLGTTAYLNDTESLEDNVMEAGTLDLQLDYAGQYNESGVVTTDGSTDTDADQTGTFQVTTGQIQGNAGGVVTLTDVKPGDCGFLALCPQLVDNPGHLWVRAAGTGDAENGYAEPEPEPGDDAEGGELDDELLTTLSYLPSGLPEVPVGEDVCAFGDGTPVVAGGDDSSASDVLETLSDGIRLDGDPSDDEEDADPWPGSGADEDGPCLLFTFHVPETVGNVIQGDSFGFEVEFYAEQARHNESPENPWATPTPTPGT